MAVDFRKIFRLNEHKTSSYALPLLKWRIYSHIFGSNNIIMNYGKRNFQEKS